MHSAVRIPEFMPVLSRGRHRRQSAGGGCFMEFASYLAGQRWSDHPSCTHPLLAALARSVNDHMSDAGRPLLAPLIPSVVGLNSEDIELDLAIALRCARTAIPVVDAERARVLAVALLATERFHADRTGRPPGELSPASERALKSAPDADRWARRFIQQMGSVEIRNFRGGVAVSTVRHAVPAIAQAPVADPDSLLFELLAGAIGDCAGIVERAAIRQLGNQSGPNQPVAGRAHEWASAPA